MGVSGETAASRAVSILDPVEAPNACPSCGHTPRTTTECFGVRIECFDWRGRRVFCLCTHDAHFGGSW
jgi:hypothetical protein